MTHTSGIPNVTSFPDYSTSEATPTNPKALVDRFRDKPLDFQPGEKWSYSNSGYVLLGHLLEKISGQTSADFVRQNIFKPLGMKHSGYDSSGAQGLYRICGVMCGNIAGNQVRNLRTTVGRNPVASRAGAEETAVV